MLRWLRSEDVVHWLTLPCARPVSRTRIRALVEGVTRTERFEGTIVLGVVDDKVFIIDGLHRIEAFKLSKLPAIAVDIRVHRLQSLREATDLFMRLNSTSKKNAPAKRSQN